MNIADITIMGSGLSTTATLIELYSKLLNQTTQPKPLNIVVIEKYKEFWLGMPYGSRSSVNALSITHVYDFIYEPERPVFFKWLKDNLQDWVDYYRQHGGATAVQWLTNNLPLIDKEDWETVYIPRFVFGKYILQKLLGLQKLAEEKQLITLTTIQAEATDLKILENGQFEITLQLPDNSHTNLTTHKAVLSVGSPPMKKMVDNANENLVYINDIYEPSVNENLKFLSTSLQNTTNKEDRNVLIIGTNASSIELLYLLNGHDDITQLINNIVLISPSGLLPHPISAEVLAHHRTPNLDELQTNGGYTLETLITATGLDLKLAVENGANVGYIATVVGKTIQLVEALGQEAKKIFIGKYGMVLSGMFRRAGHEYKHGSDTLIEAKNIEFIKGKFTNTIPTNNGVLLNYFDNATGKHLTHLAHFKIIINCSGSSNLDESSSPLIYNIVNKGIGTMNLSGKGLEVNENFEIAPNLYVMGPLLGGNMNKLIHFWHLENAPRIMYLAPHLAGNLLVS